jgi:hypothetical protein
MKFWLIVALVVGGYWASKFAGQEQAKREIAQAKQLSNESAVASNRLGSNSIEQEVMLMADQSRSLGLPRQVTQDITLKSVLSAGTQLIGHYEFSTPAAIPITNQLIAEMREEIIQNFRSSPSCKTQAGREMLRRGVTIVQHYSLFRSYQTILTIELGARDC